MPLNRTSRNRTTGAWPGVARLLACALAMEILLAGLLSLGDLRYHIPEAVGLLLLTSLFYILSVYICLQFERDPGFRRRRAPMMAILAAAALFRLTVWPLEPAFSDDVFRYRWEGMVQAEGGNPYQVRPADADWAHLRDETWPRVGSKDFKAGYGPLIELMEWATYRAVAHATGDPHRQAFWFKAPAALFDAATVAALLGLLAARGLPASRVLIYAWCPLVTMEFWGTGHNDPVALFFIALAFWAAARERWWAAFTSLSLAAAAKIWPLILFPLFVGRRGFRPLRWKEWTAVLPVAGLLAIPYWSDVEENARFLTGFVGGWRNNDGLYGPLLWLAGDASTAKHAAFAIVGLVVAGLVLARWPLEKAALTAITALLLVSSNCHPWYLTWLVPLLAVVPVPALLLWTALAPLAYRVVIAWALLGIWEGSTPWRWWIHGPVLAWLFFMVWDRLRAWLERRRAPRTAA